MSDLVSPERRTLPGLLDARLERDPDGPLILIDGRQLSARQLDTRVGRIAAGLVAHQLSFGRHAGLMCRSPLDFISCWFALARIGAVCVPINPELQGVQLERLIEHSRIEALIFDAGLEPQLLRTESASRSRIRLGVTIGERPPPGLEFPRTCTLQDLDCVLGQPEIRVAPEDPASIIYTGGTTGPSKGVVCSHSQYFWWARLMSRAVGLRRGDVWFTCLPFFHINAQGSFLATLHGEASTAAAERFSASRYWTQVRKSGAAICSLLGSLAQILCSSQPADSDDRNHQVRTVFCPAIPGEVAGRFEDRFGVRTLNAFGMTELNCVTATPPGETASTGSMGKALPEFEVIVADEKDQPVPDGQTGEFLVRPRHPDSVLSGYYRDSVATRKAWRNGWFHTGDRVRRDADGSLFFVDRLKDCIRRHGENISSYEVESVVNAHPMVVESAAYPVTAELGIEEVMVSVTSDGGALVPSDLAVWCQKRLARFAVPRFIEIVDSLPKTPVGRVRKNELRERGVGSGTWDRLSGGRI